MAMKKNKDCLRILKNISYLCIMKPLAKDTRNLRRMIAIAASISIGLVSQGQEMIRQSIDFNNCDSSIVRQFTKNIAYCTTGINGNPVRWISFSPMNAECPLNNK